MFSDRWLFSFFYEPGLLQDLHVQAIWESCTLRLARLPLLYDMKTFWIDQLACFNTLHLSRFPFSAVAVLSLLNFSLQDMAQASSMTEMLIMLGWASCVRIVCQFQWNRSMLYALSGRAWFSINGYIFRRWCVLEFKSGNSISGIHSSHVAGALESV